MAIIVEEVSRSGVVVKVHRFNSGRIEIGRSYQSDLILHDAHVEPKHLVIGRDLVTGSLTAQDQNSLNGSWMVKADKRGTVHGARRSIKPVSAFYSGQLFQLGKTYLRVCDDLHHVPDAIPMSPWEETAHNLAHWWLWAGLAVCLVLLSVWDSFLSLPLSDKLSQNTLKALYPLIGAFAFAGIFAFLGKNYRHDPKLSSHFTIAVAGLLVFKLIDVLSPYLAYWLSIVDTAGVTSELFSIITIFTVGYLSLALSTPLKRGARFVAASVVPATYLITLAITLLSRPEFIHYPAYDKNLIQPAWQVGSPDSVQDFLADSQALYAQ